MAAGDLTQAGPYTLPLSAGAITAIEALRTSANDHWMSVVTADKQVFVLNIEEA